MSPNRPRQAVDERRSFPRIESTLPLRFSVLERHAALPEIGQRTRAIARNLSGGGICFTSRTPLEPRRMVALELDLPGKTGRVLCMGKVVWCRRSSQGICHFDVGVEFWWIGLKDETAQREVGRFILNTLRQKEQGEADLSKGF